MVRTFLEEDEELGPGRTEFTAEEQRRLEQMLETPVEDDEGEAVPGGLLEPSCGAVQYSFARELVHKKTFTQMAIDMYENRLFCLIPYVHMYLYTKYYTAFIIHISI